MSHWEADGQSDEWYTPAYIFEAMRPVMFDMDVAAPVDGPRHVPCREWLSADSLTAQWSGFVWMNPPFGAQHDNRGADRRFLTAAAELGGVSYSVHNADSREFIEAFAADHGGTVTAAFAAELEIDHQFAFHEADSKAIDAEVFRIEWTTQ